ncbi:MAG TPA: GNAT family N-acetyltransferase [Ktedonobacterales bacterium]|nr:GNAT family N-acetyltransferase [Ktedonobacterales bacterium]
MIVPPLSGMLRARRVTLADLEGVLDLYNSFDIPRYGQPNQSLESIRTVWTAPDFDLASDAWLVVTADDRPIGYIHVMRDEENSFLTNGGVHPTYRRQGIGTHLLRLATARAQAQTAQLQTNAPVTMRSFCLVKPINEAEAHLLEREGYGVVRHFWDMELDLLTSPPVLVWPEGIRIRTFIPGKDEQALFEVFSEVFQDTWGYTRQTFETWAHDVFVPNSFDPTLAFLACAGDTVVGFALCVEFGEMGTIDQLGVRRPWRRRGLARALLLHCFQAFAQRGKQTAHLSVDSESLTGASRVYAGVGMRVTIQHALYEKMLPGEQR